MSLALRASSLARVVVLLPSVFVGAVDDSLSAQRVWPPGYANQIGEAAQSTPFTVHGHWTPRGSRNVTLMEASTLPFGPGSTLDAIAFRRDAQINETYQARSGTFELEIGTVENALDPQARIENPWDDRPSVRVASGLLQLPAASPPGGQPAPFDVRIPFDTPYTWPGGDLGLDLVFTSSADEPWRRDAVYRVPAMDGLSRVVGSGCPTSAGLVPHAWIAGESAFPGGTLVTRVRNAPFPAGQGAIVQFGLRTAPIPLEPLGMPQGCRLHLAALTTGITMTESFTARDAQASLTLPLPRGASLIGARLDAQWALYDGVRSERVPIVMSDSIEIELGSGARSPGNFGRCFWGRGVQRTWERFSGRLGPVDYVPVVRFEGTFQ